MFKPSTPAPPESAKQNGKGSTGHHYSTLYDIAMYETDRSERTTATTAKGEGRPALAPASHSHHDLSAAAGEHRKMKSSGAIADGRNSFGPLSKSQGKMEIDDDYDRFLQDLALWRSWQTGAKKPALPPPQARAQVPIQQSSQNIQSSAVCPDMARSASFMPTFGADNAALDDLKGGKMADNDGCDPSSGRPARRRRRTITCLAPLGSDVTLRDRLCRHRILVAVLSFVLIIMSIMIFLVCPRSIDYRITEIIPSARDIEHFAVIDSVVHGNASTMVHGTIRNNNFFPVYLNQASLKAWWNFESPGHQARAFIANSSISVPQALKINGRSSKVIKLSFPIVYDVQVYAKDGTVSSTSGPNGGVGSIALDYLKRCMHSEANDRIIRITYEVEMSGRSFFLTKSKPVTTHATLQIPCPIPPDHTAETLQQMHLQLPSTT